MKNCISRRIITTTIGIICIIVFNSEIVLACDCETPSVCVAYSQASSIFIGKLEKVEKDKNNPNVVDVFYKVEKTFKGSPQKVEKQRFVIGNCNRDFIIGEKYFVYKEDVKTSYPCNRTGLLSEAKAELDYVNKLSKENPTFSIHGSIWKLSEKELEKVKISISDERDTYKVIINKNGIFKFTTKKIGRYSIKIELPFSAGTNVVQNGWVTSIAKTSQLNSKTIIEYELLFKPNACDHRTIFINKRKDKVVSIKTAKSCEKKLH